MKVDIYILSNCISNGNHIKGMREYENVTVYSECSHRELLWWKIKLNLFILKKEILVKVKYTNF